MPIYEYKCEECGYEFEEMLRFSEREVPLNTLCKARIFDRYQEPQCFDCNGKIHLKVSLGSFHLKGYGWAQDGYAERRFMRKYGSDIELTTDVEKHKKFILKHSKEHVDTIKGPDEHEIRADRKARGVTKGKSLVDD